MEFNAELNTRLSVIRDWLNENKIGATNDKTENIVWDIFRYVVKHSIENDIPTIKEKLKQTSFTIIPGNLWEYLLEYFDGNNKYVAFFQDISELTPCGLNSHLTHAAESLSCYIDCFAHSQSNPKREILWIMEKYMN